MTDEEWRRLTVFKEKVDRLLGKVGLRIRRLGAGNRWEPIDHYIGRQLRALAASEALTCDCASWENRGSHSEHCTTFRYAIIRAEAQELGVHPLPDRSIS